MSKYTEIEHQIEWIRNATFLYSIEDRLQNIANILDELLFMIEKIEKK